MRIEVQHGEDIAALFDIYVGRAHLYYNPKIRLERVIYRGIREAQNASRSLEQREREFSRKERQERAAQLQIPVERVGLNG